jgi:hypothetical protein
MSENLFSKIIIRQRQIFATANNSHAQTSRPKRHRLTEFLYQTKQAIVNRLLFAQRYIRLSDQHEDSNGGSSREQTKQR